MPSAVSVASTDHPGDAIGPDYAIASQTSETDYCAEGMHRDPKTAARKQIDRPVAAAQRTTLENESQMDQKTSWSGPEEDREWAVRLQSSDHHHPGDLHRGILGLEIWIFGCGETAEYNDDCFGNRLTGDSASVHGFPIGDDRGDPLSPRRYGAPDHGETIVHPAAASTLLEVPTSSVSELAGDCHVT